MDAVEYVMDTQRMCYMYGDKCAKCPFTKSIGYCALFSSNELDKEMANVAVTTVEEWAKENPRKTYLSVLKEKFPKTKEPYVSGLKERHMCPHWLFGEKSFCGEEYCDRMGCEKCWDREFKE